MSGRDGAGPQGGAIARGAAGRVSLAGGSRGEGRRTGRGCGVPLLPCADGWGGAQGEADIEVAQGERGGMDRGEFSASKPGAKVAGGLGWERALMSAYGESGVLGTGCRGSRAITALMTSLKLGCSRIGLTGSSTDVIMFS